MKHKKNYYQFTLILSGVNENTPTLEDSLYEAGCDDALIHFRNNAVYIDFDRAGRSLEDAVLKAIREVESCSLGVEVLGVAPDDLVTESEIAERLNKTRQAVSLWIKQSRRAARGIPFPPPRMKLAERSPLWCWREVTEWLYQNGLITDPELIEHAQFIENLNAVLEERDEKIHAARNALLKKIQMSAALS